MKNLPALLALAILPLFFLGCKTSDPLIGASEQYSCTGSNPFWKLEITAENIEFTLLSGEKEVYPYKAPIAGNDRKLFVTSREVNDGKSWLKISIEEQSCQTTSAGKKFPFKVEVDRDSEVYYGCGE
jgi:uncharacterized membrane protein